MVTAGLDMQGYNWDALHCPREFLKKQRVKDFENYLSLVEPPVGRQMERARSIKSNQEFYRFKYGNMAERCSIGHFQLRKLVWATSKNDVYYLSDDTVRQWIPQGGYSRPIASLPFKVISMACKYDLLFAGGAMGEYACQRLDNTESNVCYGMTTQDINGTTNHLDLFMSRTGVKTGLVSGNDNKVRYLRFDTMTFADTLSMPFPVNCTAISPDKNLLCSVGDSTQTILADANSGAVMSAIDEHHDFSFSCAWSPDGRFFVTGNQDKTARVYDIRNTSKTLHLLAGSVGAIRSVQFSNDGEFLIAAEPIDYVHLYHTKTFDTEQVINLFGAVAGVALTPDDQALFICNADNDLGCGLYEFQRVEDEQSTLYI
ncbi:uncharacterized protein BYT42DRAFT_559166 [Radiomyces spectabilis]|uniref:uncharacterized protein n=1 Tax=Radiomyces spectabilis TaxID=64574 RepID=UPI0022207536|nr:uncharacterized protein BYT42DRAFT_559166 [Radiomyces spectabilis]KAI8388175.1 hypothetical protein BYT42DRAFT_559166 [Radiomyces spectabilis]